MRTQIFAAALCLAGIGLPLSQANAVIIVLGDTAAARCYQAAEYGDPSGFDICNQALQDPKLSRRDEAATYTNRGVIRLQAGDTYGALSDSDIAIKLMPYVGETYVDRGAALLALDRSAEELQSIDYGMSLGMQKIHLAYFDRAVAKEKVGDIRGAYFDYKKSAELRPDFVLAVQQLERFKVIKTADTPKKEAEGEANSGDEMIALITPLPPTTHY